MVLVDTTVWIRFLSKRLDQSEHLAELLMREEVAGHAFVYGELLIGDPGGRLPLLNDYKLMVHVRTLDNEEVVDFVQKRRLNGQGIGWIDAHLLASSLASRTPLWTADTRLNALAKQLNIAHEPT